MKGFTSLSALYLAAFSACILFSYNVVLKHVGIPKASLGQEQIVVEDGRRLSVNDYMEKRIAEVFRETWPECVHQKMHAVKCKEFIDEEILTTFTERDKYIRVIIKDKRKKYDSWYNTVVIYMDDNDMAKGRDADGLIYYDFEWDGSGEPTTPDQEADIPPILATETEAGSPTADPNTVGPAADPNSPEYEPLIIEIEPILVIGASVGGARSGDSNPIAGGVIVDPNAPNTPEGDEKLMLSLALADEETDPDGNAIVEAAGSRTLPVYDCTGLTGYNCCLMIKLKVRDHDNQNKAIQCQLVYEEGSNKDQFWLNSRGKKVFIFANHNEIVSKIPKIVGDWPKGVGNFSGWLEDGGDPNRTDWVPPPGT